MNQHFLHGFLAVVGSAYCLAALCSIPSDVVEDRRGEQVACVGREVAFLRREVVALHGTVDETRAQGHVLAECVDDLAQQVERLDERLRFTTQAVQAVHETLHDLTDPDVLRQRQFDALDAAPGVLPR